MSRATVILADDHAIVAEGVGRLLIERFELLAIVGDGADLVEKVKQLKPDIAVVDVSMPTVSGLEAMQKLRDAGSATRVLFLTMHADPELAAEAMRNGAVGFLLKEAAGEELINALEEVLRGGVYLSPRIAKDVLAAMCGMHKPQAHLTPRQHEVLRLMVNGYRMKEVAATLGLSVRTVESHKYEMMDSLGVHSTAELVRYAIRAHLVAP